MDADTDSHRLDALLYLLQGLNMSNVESPQHYTQGFFETIYEIRDVLGHEGFKAFCMGNYIKYNARAQHKGLRSEDLAKADQYLDWAVNGLPAPVDGRVPRQADPYAAMAEAVQERAFREGESRLGGAVEELGAPYGGVTSAEVHKKIAEVLSVHGSGLHGCRLKVSKEGCQHGHVRFHVSIYVAVSEEVLAEGYIYGANPSTQICTVAAMELIEHAVANMPF